MAIQFVPFTAEYEDAARGFNSRLKAGNAATSFYLGEPPESNPPGMCPMLAVEDSAVRGSYLEVTYPIHVAGQSSTAINCQSPLSEGLVDPKYLFLPSQMFKHILRQNPFAFVVGMGGLHNPLPRFLKAGGWSVDTIPFFFRVAQPARFLREMPMLRQPAWKNAAAQVAALTGAGTLAMKLLQRSASSREWQITCGQWDNWCEPLWQEYQAEVLFSACRDLESVRRMYPAGGRVDGPLVLTRQGRIEGWSVVLLTQMQNHAAFGNLRVGTIIDGLARPESRFALADHSARYLAEAGADLIISNQSHLSWQQAYRAAGFRSGPSNYVLAMSPKLTKALGTEPVGSGRIHLTRGDGDGCINL